MHSVIVVDDNQQWLDLLSKEINEEPSFEVIGKALDGKTALELIEHHKPDIIILDIIMPEYDGVFIINFIRNNMVTYKPKIYILSGLGTDSIIQTMNKLEVDFYSLKPVQISSIIQNLKNMFEQKNKSTLLNNLDLENKIDQLLHQMGLIPYRLATKYIKQAVIYFINNPDSARKLTKVIYPEVAKKCGVKSAAVERNIRYGVTKIQDIGSDIYKTIFSNVTFGNITNGEFISILANYILNLDN